jgi:hypothetical protein
MASATGFLVPILYTEVCGRDEQTRQDLETLVALMDWQYVVSLCGGIAALSWRTGVEDAQHQAALVTQVVHPRLYGPAVQRLMRFEPHRVMFSREGLFALLRVAVSVGAKPGAQLSAAETMDCFTRCMLIANELLSNETNIPNPTHTATDLLASELRSAPLFLENHHDLLVRTDAMFEWSKSPKGVSSSNAMPLEADFRRFTGLPWKEHAASSSLVLARATRYRQWEDVVAHGISFSADELLAGFSRPEAPKAWLATHACPIATLQPECVAKKSLSFAAAGSLWTRPVVQAEDGRYFVPSPALVANLMGDGAYFLLADGYAEEDKRDGVMRRGRFTSYYGEFFQDYVTDLFRRSYDGRADSKVECDVEYVGDDGETVRSSDIIVAEGGDVIFIEVVAKRMNLESSVVDLDHDAIATDLLKAAICKAWQIHRNIEDFANGTLLPAWERHSSQRFFPVLVTPNDLPRINLIHDALAKAMAQDGLFNRAHVKPMEFIDVAEVEHLEPALHDGMRLAALLDRKNSGNPHHRVMTMHNYLLTVPYERGTLPERLTPSRLRGNDIARDLLDVSKGWV